MDKSDTETVSTLAEELSQKHARMEISLSAISALQIAGLLQLALRHPNITSMPATTARTYLAGVREYFADCPTVLDVLRRGDDPTEDLPWTA